MNKILKFLKKKQLLIILVAAVMFFTVGLTSTAYAFYHCGGTQNNNHPVNLSIDLGCTGQGNPISDLLFAIIRLLADGVGIVVVASVVVAGIQFSASRGDPQATSSAIDRIRTSVVALLIFLFGYGILNWLVPGGFLH